LNSLGENEFLRILPGKNAPRYVERNADARG
jgi:hypothetical protein